MMKCATVASQVTFEVSAIHEQILYSGYSTTCKTKHSGEGIADSARCASAGARELYMPSEGE